MSKLIRLAVLAGMTASMASAVKITFQRYSQGGCNAATQHIAADTHLKDPYCKSFDEDEPAFYSYILKAEDDWEDTREKYCFITVYDLEDCHGQAFQFGNMSDYKDQCVNSPVPGRSVRVSCMNAQTTFVDTIPSTTLTETHQTVVIDDPTGTILVPDPTTFLTSTEEFISTTDIAKPRKKHHSKHHKGGKDDVEDVVVETVTGNSDTTFYTVAETSTTSPLETITLVPAPRKTDENIVELICAEHPHWEGCADVTTSTSTPKKA